MKHVTKLMVAFTLVAALLMSLAACSTEVESIEQTSSVNTAALESILENMLKAEDYIALKEEYPKTAFEEKVEGESIVININGKEGINGRYEFKQEGDYITYTESSNTEDYTGAVLFTHIREAVAVYLGMEPSLLNGYEAGCEVFGRENKYLITDIDDGAGTTTRKIYIAQKYGFEGLDEMYITKDSFQYQDSLSEEPSNGFHSVGKMTLIYSGDKNNVTFIFREYGKRSDLTYKSIMDTVAFFQPTGADTFAKYYTQLMEGEDDGFKVSFGLDEKAKQAYPELQKEDGYEYTVVRFGA